MRGLRALFAAEYNRRPFAAEYNGTLCRRRRRARILLHIPHQ
jgi:hypothetical protein